MVKIKIRLPVLSAALVSLLLAGIRETDGQTAAGGTNGPPTASTNAPPATSTNNEPELFDQDDGWLDMSGFLDTAYGFVPMIVPITEPAVGYGAAAGLIFIDRNEPSPGGRPAPPNIATVGGGATENGTWAVFAGDSAWGWGTACKPRGRGGYGEVT